jgi:hypothetical protein
LQARYGWTDDVILSLPYHVFNQKLRTVSKAIAREKKDALRQAAFIGWQVYSTAPRLTANEKRIDFSKWLKMFSLDLEQESKRIDNEIDYEAEAERIDELVRNAFKKKVD